MAEGGGATLGRDTTALRCDTMQQQATTRRRERAGGARMLAEIRPPRPSTRPGQACDTARPGLRHGQARPATWRGVHARCAQAGQCVHTVHLTLF